MRELIEKAGIDADATPVDVFFAASERGIGYSIGASLGSGDFDEDEVPDEPIYEQDYDAACRIIAAEEVNKLIY